MLNLKSMLCLKSNLNPMLCLKSNPNAIQLERERELEWN